MKAERIRALESVYWIRLRDKQQDWLVRTIWTIADLNNCVNSRYTSATAPCHSTLQTPSLVLGLRLSAATTSCIRKESQVSHDSWAYSRAREYWRVLFTGWVEFIQDCNVVCCHDAVFAYGDIHFALAIKINQSIKNKCKGLWPATCWTLVRHTFAHHLVCQASEGLLS